MVCTSCGAAIADKAIVCYRCGTATAIPESVRPAGVTQAPRGLRWLLPLLLVAVALALGWFAARGTEDPAIRVAATIAAVLVGVAGPWLFIARRR